MRYLLIICLTVALILDCVKDDVRAEDNKKWVVAGDTNKGLFTLSIDVNSLYINKEANEVSFVGKRELSKKGKEQMWKDFLEEAEIREKETGTKIEDKELLFEKAVVPFTTKIDNYLIVCKEKKIKRLLPMQGSVGMSIVDDIKQGTTEEKIYEQYCQKGE